MLDTIKEILFGLWDVIQLFFKAFTGFLGSLGDLIKYLTHATEWLPVYWAAMPHLWTMFFPSLIGIVVVYKFMNRT